MTEVQLRNVRYDGESWDGDEHRFVFDFVYGSREIRIEAAIRNVDDIETGVTSASVYGKPVSTARQITTDFLFENSRWFEDTEEML